MLFISINSVKTNRIRSYVAAATVSSSIFPLVNKLKSRRNKLVDIIVMPSLTFSLSIWLHIVIGTMTIVMIKGVTRVRVIAVVQFCE